MSTQEPARRTVRRRTAAQGAEETGRGLCRRAARPAEGAGPGSTRARVLTAFASPRRLAAHVTDVRRAGRRQGGVAKADAGQRRARRLRQADAGAAEEAAGAGRRRLGRARPQARHGRQGRSAVLRQHRQGRDAGRGPAEGAGRKPRQAADPQGHDLPAGRRLERRQVRAPGACAGGAARQRGRAGRSAGPEGRHAPRTATASRRRVDPVVLQRRRQLRRARWRRTAP